MVLSKERIKYIRSLEMKKNRKADKVFVAEGTKLVEELLEQLPCRMLVATREWISAHEQSLSVEEIFETTEKELSRASFLKTPQQVLAVFMQPDEKVDVSTIKNNLCLALDDVQDPGNLGTIIRVADWFGIEQIFCSPGTVDLYNPKTVQATMGSIARVKLTYTSLPLLIQSLPEIPIYGTFLEGENIYEQPLSTLGLIVMGNEGNGISEEVKRLVNHRLYIPNYPHGQKSSESLNVAMATAIVCAEFRRRAFSL